MIQNFLKDLLSIWRLILSRHRKELYKVVSLESISVVAKLSSIMVLAGAVYCLQYETSIQVFGNQIDLKPTVGLIIIIGVVLGFLGILDTQANFSAFKISRRLGRQACEHAQKDTLEHVNIVQPNVGKISNPIPISISPRNLTQIPLHTGLSHQSLALLVNPLLTIIVLAITIFVIDYRLTILVLLIALPLFPILVSQSRKTQSNAAMLYGEKGAKMGKSSSNILNLCLNQHGSYSRSIIIKEWLENNPERKDYLESVDTNLLAVRKLNNNVGIFGSLARAAVFIVVCVLYFLHNYPLEKLIVILGAISHLFGATKMSSAMLSKLALYRPQLKIFLATRKSLDEFVDNITADNLANTCHKNFHVFTNSSTAREKFSTVFQHLISDGHLSANTQTYYLSKEFQYIPNISIIDQLCGGHITSERQNKVTKLLLENSELKLFENSPQGLETHLQHSIWQGLSAHERLLLKIGGLIHVTGCSIQLDSQILKPLGAKAADFLAAILEDNQLVITHCSTDTITDNDNCHFFIIDDDESISCFTNDFKAFNSKAKSVETLQKIQEPIGAAQEEQLDFI